MCLAKRRFSVLTLGGETEHMYRKGRRVQIRSKTSKQVRVSDEDTWPKNPKPEVNGEASLRLCW